MATTEINQALSHLRQERARLSTAIAALEALSGVQGSHAAPAATPDRPGRGHRGGRRTMSAEARAKIAASQRARWARLRGGASAKSAAKPVAKQGGHRTHSEATRQKIALAAKARWARIKGKK